MSERTSSSSIARRRLHRKDLDPFVELHDPECEIRPRANDVEGGPYHGDGVRAYWRDMHAAFTDWVVEIEERAISQIR